MTATPAPDRRWVDTALAWYFVSVWGSGFLASKTALLYAPPFTMLTLRGSRKLVHYEGLRR